MGYGNRNRALEDDLFAEITRLREELIAAKKSAMLWIANHGEAQERAERAEEENARLRKQVYEEKK